MKEFNLNIGDQSVLWPGPGHFRVPGPLGAYHHTTQGERTERLQVTPSATEIQVINSQLDVTDIETLCPDLLTGMYSPRVVTLSSGLIYKFTSSKLSPSRQVASPWWFSDTEFQKILQYSRLDPQNLGFIARCQAAVRYEWSDMDMLVCATVSHPIRVFIGLIVWQLQRTKAGSNVVFQAPHDLLQLYVPNIVDPIAKTLNANGKKAFHSFRYVRIPSGDQIDQAIQNLQGKQITLLGNPTLH